MIIIINGPPAAGKDTFVQFCAEIKMFTASVYNFSTIDYVKDLAKQMGWDGSKTPKNRKFLSDLKQLLTDWNDIPFKETVEDIELTIYWSDKDTLIFVHCREPEEIKKLKDYFQDKAITLFIDRKVNEEEISNTSDLNVRNYEYDYYIENNGTLSDLRAAAEEFLKNI